MLTIEVPTTSSSEPSSRRRTWARRGEAPSQKEGKPAASATAAASPALSSPIWRKLVQTPHSPKSMRGSLGRSIRRPFRLPWRGSQDRRRRVIQSSDQRKEVVLILSHMLGGTLEVQGR